MSKLIKKVLDLRVAIHATELKKSGKNKHIGFSYFELSDFLPATLKKCGELGLLTKFDVLDDKATLTVHDVESDGVIVFETTRASATLVKATPVQELGAEHTYLKRYLYGHLLDLIENDVVDAEMGKEDKPEPKATPQQLKQLTELFDDERLLKLVQHAKVETIADLTVAQASHYIKAELKKQNG